MKITVCEFPDEVERKEAAWTALVRFLRTNPTDVVILPEMPFCAWHMFMTRTIDPNAWEAALPAHDEMLERYAGTERRYPPVLTPGGATRKAS